LDWRRLSAEELEYQFNPRRAVPDTDAYQAERRRLSHEVLARLPAHVDLPYGAAPRHTLDVFPARPAGGGPAPLHLFLHGGYWRGQDKAGFAFLADTLVRDGICTVIPNYDLCPTVTLEGVVASAMRAIAWTVRCAAEFGADPERLTLSGNSAGAHLVAMALARDWAADALPADPVKGAVMISGIYDPEPARHISVNEDLRLTEEIARRHDAVTLPPRVRCPVRLFVGAEETPAWIEQTELYAAHLRRHGLDPVVSVLPGEHHASITDQFADRNSPIVRAVLELVHGAGHGGPAPDEEDGSG